MYRIYFDDRGGVAEVSAGGAQKLFGAVKWVISSSARQLVAGAWGIEGLIKAKSSDISPTNPQVGQRDGRMRVTELARGKTQRSQRDSSLRSECWAFGL
jgi:hypothetical protein